MLSRRIMPEGENVACSKSLQFALVLLFALMSAGCVSTAGLSEFRQYRDSFERVNVASTAIFDEMGAAERAKARQLFLRGLPPVPATRTASQTIKASGFDEQFYIEDAPYVSQTGDPPATAAFRRSIAAVAVFNDIVLAYAEGRSLSELKREAAVLGSVVQEALHAVGGARVIGGLSMPAVGAALTLVKAGADQAVALASRAAFRDAVVAQQPNIDAILVTVRDGTPAIFGLLTGDLADSAKDAMDRGDKATAQVFIAQIETYRKMLSDWVLLLDDTRTALRATIAAMEHPYGCDPPLFVHELAASADQLRARTESIRNAIVTLRRGL
ncbi:MAG: hypothetical protein GX443_10585 [Deltaproteobacteria bacterium]|nr:hypothetical protein [Deltaproteobacteria bacterium]